MSSIARIVAVLMALSFLLACGGAQRREFGKTPDWYDNPPKGCGAASAVLRGIRQAARDAAVSSARAELARSIQTVIQTMIKRYISEGEAEAKDFSEELQTSVVRDVTEMTMTGTRVVKTASRENELFALVCLDPETFADAFDRMAKLSEKARAALKKRAEDEFRDLDAQLKKLKDQE